MLSPIFHLALRWDQFDVTVGDAVLNCLILGGGNPSLFQFVGFEEEKSAERFVVAVEIQFRLVDLGRIIAVPKR